MDFLSSYGMFFLEVFTIVLAFIIVIGFLLGSLVKMKSQDLQQLEIKKLNDKFEETAEMMKGKILGKTELKTDQKRMKKEIKEAIKNRKKGKTERKKRVYVIDFKGDIAASQVSSLREEVNATLSMAESKDEVVVLVDSPGGMVPGYGLAASQLQRIRDQNIPLTVCIDRIAASGGYMVASVANKILAAPFAIIGSIGVVAQIPNFHSLLKKNDIDYEILTAGKYKRTLTVFGENTEEGREKFIEDLNMTHELFKSHVQEARNEVDINAIATGEYWYGKTAIKHKLVDEIKTSDEYLYSLLDAADIFSIEKKEKKSVLKKLGVVAGFSLESLLSRFGQVLAPVSER